MKMEGELPLNRAEDNILVKKLLCTAVLLFGATALRADVFSFSYAGTFFGNTVSATGTVIATATLPNIYTITGLSGIRNGVSISAPSINKGSFIYSGSSSVGSFNFLLNGSGSDLLSFSGGLYTESGVTGTNIGNNFSIRSVPEAATLSLLFTMGLGVWLLARKLPSKTPLS
jgi:hypothetical protein